MAAGQPSIYGPTKLWGPTTLGSMACVYGPAGANVVKVTGLTVASILSTSATNGVGFFVGPSGSTGAATGAVVPNLTVPNDGIPVPIIPKYLPELTLSSAQVIHAMSSMASGFISFGYGIEMQ